MPAAKSLNPWQKLRARASNTSDVNEPRRNGFFMGVLIGLVVVFGLGTAFVVAVPFGRCPDCHWTRQSDGTVVRRVRVAGRWETSTDAECDCCGKRVGRGKVTLLKYLLTQARRR
jgi:hypothetical protein